MYVKPKRLLTLSSLSGLFPVPIFSGDYDVRSF